MSGPGGKRRFVEDASGEEYVHKTVWLVAKRQMRHAEANPRGALLDHMAAMVFASHALEGYLNFLGGRIAGDLWADERDRFRRTGAAGKLDALAERCELPPFEKGRRPRSTVSDLKRLRDRIAHPRTITDEATTHYLEGDEPPLFARSWLEGAVSPKRAERALSEIEEIARLLHAAALARFPEARLDPDPLGGILSMRSTRAKLAED